MSYADDLVEFNQWKQDYLSTARPDLANILLTNILASQNGGGTSNPDIEADLTRILEAISSTGVKSPLLRDTVSWATSWPNNWLTILSSNPNRKALFLHIPTTETTVVTIGYRTSPTTQIQELISLSPGSSYSESLPFHIIKHELLARVEREPYSNSPVKLMGWQA